MISYEFLVWEREHKKIEDDIREAAVRLERRLDRKAKEAYIHTRNYSYGIKVDGLQIKPIEQDVFKNCVVIA